MIPVVLVIPAVLAAKPEEVPREIGCVVDRHWSPVAEIVRLRRGARHYRRAEADSRDRSKSKPAEPTILREGHDTLHPSKA